MTSQFQPTPRLLPIVASAPERFLVTLYRGHTQLAKNVTTLAAGVI